MRRRTADVLSVHDAFVEAIIDRLRARTRTRVFGDQVARVRDRLHMLERQPALDAEGYLEFCHAHLAAFRARTRWDKANPAESDLYKAKQAEDFIAKCLQGLAASTADSPSRAAATACVQWLWQMLGQKAPLKPKELDEVLYPWRGRRLFRAAVPMMTIRLLYLAVHDRHTSRDDLRAKLRGVKLQLFAYL